MIAQLHKKPDVTAMLFGKVPPQALELEEAILGACMLEKETFENVMEIIRNPEIFYSDPNQKIYACMLYMHQRGEQIDLLTIGEGLRKTGELEAIGGMYFLGRLTQAVMSSAHAVSHAQIVFEKFMQREIIRICGYAINTAYEDATDPFELQDRIDTELKKITEGIGGGESTQVGETYMEILMDIEERADALNNLIGVDTGYAELNDLTLGWEEGTVIVLGARPSQGKTALMLNLAENAVTSRLNQAGEALIFSLETAKKPLVRRLAACRCNVPLKKIRSGRLEDVEKKTMNGMAADFARLPIRIIDDVFHLNKIVAIIRRAHKKYAKAEAARVAGLRKQYPGKEFNIRPMMVLIDYIQLIEVGRMGTREQEVSKISRDLKTLTSELKIITIELAQLNKDSEKRSDKKPDKSDLRESGALQQDAHQILLIWHQELEGKNKEGLPNFQTWVLLHKNKDGETGDVKLRFAGDIQKWKNFEDFNQSEMPSGAIIGCYTRDPSQVNETWDDA